MSMCARPIRYLGQTLSCFWIGLGLRRRQAILSQASAIFPASSELAVFFLNLAQAKTVDDALSLKVNVDCT